MTSSKYALLKASLITFNLAIALTLPAKAQLALNNPGNPADFILSDGTNVTAIFAEPTEDRAVTRAVGDLAEDVSRVTGLKPSRAEKPDGGKSIVLIGTLGHSQTIDQLVADGKLDVTGVRGEWESYVLQVVKHPLPGLDSALVIAGSDRRGTVYGIYQLSEIIGVSPWYWWADVPVKTNKSLALSGAAIKQGPPAVKYRGIFLNDEDWGLRPWAAKTFDTNTANIGPKTYEKVFELLLRLRANYLWPAMHHDTRAFNFYPTNRELADAYGIVMGSSHCEQMLRNNVDEWKAPENQYNYVSNREGVLKYWEQRVEENGKYDNLYTMGMRGIHDSGMPGGGTKPEQAERLQRIIKDQRELLARHVNKDVAAVPQILTPYKEVLELYRLKPDVPEDITLVWPDDNYGYVRQFSNEKERKRSGGAGVYYHLSYLGRPANYLWLCTTPPALMAEELTKAYDFGADRVWVANVGDLKPAELGMEFFLKLAWNPHAWNGTNANELLAPALARDFGATNATDLVSLMSEYYRLNFQRKPEHMRVDTNVTLLARQPFAVMLNGDEAEQRLNAWQTLAKHMQAMEKNIAPGAADAFFELISYPIYASAVVNEQAMAISKYQTCVLQDRALAKDYLQWARLSDEVIKGMTEAYDHTASNKWARMMSAYPMRRTFQLPTNAPPVIATNAVLGLAIEGANDYFRTDRLTTNAVPPLPQFSRLTRRGHFVDVFSGGQAKLKWTATPDQSWIHLDHTNGTGDLRVHVSIDWSNAPAGDDQTGVIRFAAGANQEISVAVSLFNPADVSAVAGADFVEDDHIISMEAEHSSAVLPGKYAQWQPVTGLGYNGAAMTIFPATAPVLTKPKQIASESPCLQYKFWAQHAGDWIVTVRTLPTFSVETGKPQRYAIAFDDAAPEVVALPASMSETDKHWQENVLRNAALTTSKHTLAKSGQHTLKIWMVDPGIVLDTIFATTIGSAELGYTGPAETKNLIK